MVLAEDPVLAAVNQINFEIDQEVLVENGKKLGLEIDATIDGCQGGGITGGDANCDVEVQFGDIDSAAVSQS